MKTMTLNLPDREMDYLTTASRAADMSKTAFMKRALRLYALVEARQADGYRLRIGSDLVIGLGVVE